MNFRLPSNPPSLRDNESGFTLIEVIIVLVILVFISLGIYQMTTETYRLRDSLATEGAFYNSIRMSMDVIQRDVSSIYSPTISRPKPAASPNPANPQDPNNLPPPANSQDLQAIMNSDQGKSSVYCLGATEKSGLRASRFVGTDAKMSFISSSHVRIYKDRPESDFAKISYEAVRDNESVDGKKSMDDLALLRIENAAVFDDDERRAEKSAHRYMILHGIKKFRIRYWRKVKDDAAGKWSNDWDSDKEDYKEKYPDLIELTIEVSGPDRLSFTGTYKFRPEVPLGGLVPST